MTQERIEQVKKTMPERVGELATSSSAACEILTEDRYKSEEAFSPTIWSSSGVKDENGELRSLAVERAEGKLNDEASPVPKMVRIDT